MKTRSLLFVLFGLILAAPAGAAEESELVGNGGFEGGLDGWATLNRSGTLEVGVDDRERAEGKTSARLKKTGGMAADGISFALPSVPGGRSVTLSARIRGRDLGNCWLKFFVYDAAGASILEDCDVRRFTGTFDWQKVERTFELPAGAARAEVQLLLFLSGEAWIDAVSVRPPAEKPLEPLPRATAKWLDEHAFRLASLEFDAPLDDLEPLRDIVGDARIVQLGEANHGDGATFQAKARIARFLHERMGFTVLAFESGFYECERANALLAEAKVREAMDASVFGIWRTEEVRPLFDHMAASAKSERPLRLAGFDVRGSGEGIRSFMADLAEFLAPAAALPDAERRALDRVAALLDAGDAYRPAKDERKEGLAALAAARRLATEHREALVAAHGEAEVAFWEQALASYAAGEAFEFAMGQGESSRDRWATTALRDLPMADNLRFLAEVRHPGQKIVAWAATFHQAEDLEEVSVGGDARFYRGCRNLGGAAKERFGEGLYTIGFVASRGDSGRFRPEFAIPEPAPDGVEDLLRRYGKGDLFVDLRARGPFDKALFASPMGYDRSMKARWPRVLDALVHLDRQHPSTPVREGR